MGHLKRILHIGGIVFFAVGVTCLPLAYRVSPKRDQSTFASLADMGVFVKSGLLLMVVGVVVYAASRLVSGNPDDEI